MASEQQFRKFDVIAFIVQHSGAIHLVQPGLTAGWQAGKLVGRQGRQTKYL